MTLRVSSPGGSGSTDDLGTCRDAPGFCQGAKQITIGTFLPELADETFDVSILPGTADSDDIDNG